MDGYEIQNYQFRRHFLRFIDVYSFKVIIIVDNDLADIEKNLKQNRILSL